MRGRFDYSKWNFCNRCGSQNPKPKTMTTCDVHHTQLRTKARFKKCRTRPNSVRVIRVRGNGDGEYDVEIVREFDSEPVRHVRAKTVLAAALTSVVG